MGHGGSTVIFAALAAGLGATSAIIGFFWWGAGAPIVPTATPITDVDALITLQSLANLTPNQFNQLQQFLDQVQGLRDESAGAADAVNLAAG